MRVSIVIPSRHESIETLAWVNGLIRQGYDVHVTFDNSEPHGFGLCVWRGLSNELGEYVAIMMSDSSDHPYYLPLMKAMMDKGYDMVIGSRYMDGGRQIGGPLVKRTLSRLAGRLLFPIVGVHEVTNAFRMIRVSKLRELTLESNGFAFNLELTAKAHRAGWRIGEVPVTWQDRRGGRSKFHLSKELWQYLKWFAVALGWGGYGVPRRVNRSTCK